VPASSAAVIRIGRRSSRPPVLARRSRDRQAPRAVREILHLTASDARRMSWKNGGGVTDELAIWPHGSDAAAGDFEWRIARARIERSGPFSAFPGFERVLLVVEGGGLALAHGDAAPRVRPRRLEPYAFPGEWPTSAELASGNVVDLNVLAQRERWTVSVEPLRIGTRRALEELAPGHAFVHVLAGTVRARVSDEEEPCELAAGESLWASELARSAEIELRGASGDTELVVVRLEPRDA
jgi:uncharacterized protein